ncbi:MAG: tetratricopeptide repeat protein [Planctomycetes bacterium]|nr:tetratricopeptide repeat protein [Planctomycetota bacterium]
MTLNEEDEVNRLLAKAKAAREKAEKDPEVWPEAVKAYSDILAKFANTVYLSNWTDNKENGRKNLGWGLGVYRSTAEKVAEELATLPPAGLKIYRAVNDGAAQALMAETLETQNEAPMEKVAQTYFSTSWGDDALLWLGEIAYDRDASRQALSRLDRIEKHPDPSVPRVAVLARALLANMKVGLHDEAAKNYEALAEALKDAKNGELRVGHETGAQALAALKTRLDAQPITVVKAAGDAASGWETYFGNARHYQPLANKENVGVRKWSESLVRLLGAPAGTPDQSVRDIRNPDGTVQKASMPNTFLAARNGYFFICNSQVVACHSINNPNPDKCVFWYPSPPPQPQSQAAKQAQFGGQMGMLWHPQFVTLGGDHLFVTLGPEPNVIMPQWFGGNPPKQNPNWIVCLGKKKGESLGVEAGHWIWTLEPGSELNSKVNTKADQEWLKGIRFVTSPTYNSGALYVLAVSDNGANRESWCVSIEADTGRLLWKTKLCEAQPIFFGGTFQPDFGLAVAVHAGTAYCVTNLGAVAALEAATGNVRWIRIYDRISGQGNNQNMQMVPARDLWAPNPPIVFDDLLICTPQDCDSICAFDTQTGKLKWETERVSDAGFGAPGDAERLKYVMGICHNKWLVIAGKNVLFVDAKGGRRELKALVPEEDAGKVIGSGLVTDNVIWIPTEKQLLRIDSTLSAKSQKPKAKILPKVAWTDPKADPGNLFMVNDVVFSVSPSHICAYFVWEDLEKKLLDRLAANAEDLPAFVELGDGYHIVKKYDKAIEAFTKGLDAAAKKPGDPAAKAAEADLRSRRFESYFADADELVNGKPAEADAAALKKAYDRFEAGLKVAGTPDQSVRALWRMAEVALAQKDDPNAVLLYHKMLSEFGGVVYPFELKNTSKAAVFAQREIGKIKERNAKACEKLEQMAREALDKAVAAKEAKALEQFIQTFPNSNAYGDGLLALAGLHLEHGEGDAARPYYQRFLFTFRDSPKTAEVMALLALAYEKAGMTGSAKSTLLKLTRNKAFADADIRVPGAASQKAGVWAAARLQEAVYQTPATNAARRLGNGKLTESWTKPMVNTVALAPGGKAPAEMLRNILLMENNEIVVRSGLSGDEVWAPRPKAPPGFVAGPLSRCAWAEDLLVLGGQTQILALDSKLSGKEAWRIEIGPNVETGGGPITSMLGSDRRIVFAQQGGLLTVLDGGAGKEVWKTQVDGGQIFGQPDLGEGFIAVATTNPAPHKLTVYEIETGLRRLDIQVPTGRLLQGPVAVDEFIYFVSADNKLRAFNAGDGKELWNFDLEGQAQRLSADSDTVLVVLNDLTVVVCDPNAADPARRLKWKARPDGGGGFAGLVADGDEVFLAVRQNSRKGGEVSAYNARGGKLLWKTEMAGNDQLTPQDLAQGHLVVMQNAFDPQGQAASMVAVVHRGNGRRTWTQNLASGRPPLVALFDSGVAIGDGRKITGYVAVDPARSQQEATAIEAELKKNPDDPALKLKLAQFQFESKDSAKAVETLLSILNDAKATDENFAAAYERLARFRKALAKDAKPEIAFARVAQPLVCDGTLAAWQNLPAVKLDSWRDLYLAGETDARLAFKRGIWKGAPDLTATFRGGYDDKTLYLCVEVSDDIHKNAQTKPVDLRFGDSVQFAFDPERDKRMSFSGEDSWFGLALNDKGAQLAFRWLEHGKYLMKPLDAPAKVVRDEDKKLTVYQAAIPLEALSLKAEAGLKFGFTFMVNDLDAGENFEKGAAPSPGIWEPQHPGQYAVGVLSAK